MKKLFYTLLAVSIIFSACKKEEEISIAAPTVISGCMDNTALNFDPTATVDDGSCTYTEIIYGCMDTIAINYNTTATSDDGSCTFGIEGGSWITDTEEMTMHAVVSNGGMVIMDTTLTEIETNQDSMETVIQRFWDNGDFNSWDNNNNIVENGTWVQSGTTVTVTTDTVIVGEIISVTKTNLVHTVEGNETFTEDGADYDIYFTFTAYHTRNENGFTTNNTNQRKVNTPWINKRKLMNIIKR